MHVYVVLEVDTHKMDTVKKNLQALLLLCWVDLFIAKNVSTQLIKIWTAHL